MPTRTVTVGSAVGLHARPAAIIAEAAGELDSEVTIGVPGDDPVDASSSLLIMTLGAGKGATIEVSGDDQAAVDKIAALVNEHFDLRPKGIIQMLDLLRPIYEKTAAYGHFGREEPEFTWERTDKAQVLRAAAGLK